MYKTIIWSSLSWSYVPGEIDELSISKQHVFAIADDILIAEFDEHSRNHDETLTVL